MDYLLVLLVTVGLFATIFAWILKEERKAQDAAKEAEEALKQTETELAFLGLSQQLENDLYGDSSRYMEGFKSQGRAGSSGGSGSGALLEGEWYPADPKPKKSKKKTKKKAVKKPKKKTRK